MVQYVAILMIYYVVSYTFVGYKNDCHPFEEMPPAAHEYKQLRACNRYHPLDLPALTVDSRAFRNWTDFHKTTKSSSLGYPARRLELHIPKEKLKTKFPPFVRKPKVAEEPAPSTSRPPFELCCSSLRPAQMNTVTYTNTSIFIQNDSQPLT